MSEPHCNRCEELELELEECKDRVYELEVMVEDLRYDFDRIRDILFEVNQKSEEGLGV